MATFWFIRHGQSEAQLRPEFINGRSSEVPLTVKGENQARNLGENLAKEFSLGNPVHAAWHSPAIRTTSTKNIVLEALDSTIELESNDDHRILELDQGDWTGEDRHKVYTKYMLDLIQKNILDFKAPCGESQGEVTDRMMFWLSEAVSRSEGLVPYSIKPHAEHGLTTSNVLVFGHGLATKCLLCRLFGIDNYRAFDIVIDNCSVTKVDIYGDPNAVYNGGDIKYKLQCLNFVYP
jgi:broad specificity phosphatase PhoE